MGKHQFFDSGGNSLLGAQFLTLAPPIARKEGKDLLRKANALLRYHFKIDPEYLSDEQFAERWQELKWALEFETLRHSEEGARM